MKQETFTFKQRVLGGFAIPIAVFIAASGFTIAQVGKVNRTSRKLMAEQLILKDLLELSSDLNHLELSAENYAIAGNESYYEAYQDDKQHVGELLSELENLDGDVHGDLVADLTQKSNELIGLSDRLVNLVRQGNPERALEIMRTGSADNLMRETSNTISLYVDEEKAIVAADEAANLAALGSLRASAIASIVLGSGVALLTGAWLVSVQESVRKSIGSAVDSLATSCTEIATTISQQERTSTDQAASVNETTTTVEELGASARQSAAQAEAASSGAQQALDYAESGNQAVSRTMSEITQLRDTVGETAEKIIHLSEQIGLVGDVSDLVGNIANQTNMLALNAAVEAARAGEQGKGFAVVASEIRKLADQSRQSAEKIGSQVNTIQAAMNSTVMVTDESNKQAQASIRLVQDAADTFSGIAQAVNDVVVNNQQISLSAKQQAVAVQQVVSAMNAINLGAKDTSSGISELKSATASLNSTAQKLRAEF